MLALLVTPLRVRRERPDASRPRTHRRAAPGRRRAAAAGHRAAAAVGAKRRHERYGRNRRRRGSAGTGATGGTSGSGGVGGAAEPWNRGIGGLGGAAGGAGMDGGAGSGGSAGAAGSDGTGTVGDACAPNGAFACAGHAKKAPLVCIGGTWAIQRRLQRQQQLRHERREPRLVPADRQRVRGQGRGLCVLLGGNAVACGIDLVTIDPVETCTNQACVSGACTGMCAPVKQCSVQRRDVRRRRVRSERHLAGCNAHATNQVSASSGACYGGVHAGCEAVQRQRRADVLVERAVGAAVACTWPTPACSGRRVCGAPPSCQTSGPGLTDCGPQLRELLHEPAGERRDVLPELRRRESGYTSQAYPATVSDFRLDKYEITVGRFRKFVAAWDGGWRPAQGDGKHTHLNGGQGLLDSSTGTHVRAGLGHGVGDELWRRRTRRGATRATCRAARRTRPGRRARARTSVVRSTARPGTRLPRSASGTAVSCRARRSGTTRRPAGSEQRVYPWSSPRRRRASTARTRTSTPDASLLDVIDERRGLGISEGRRQVGPVRPRGERVGVEPGLVLVALR